MQVSTETARYSSAEELANSVSHGIGGVLSLGALVALVSTAHGVLAVAACTVFASTLLVTYLASTLYHAFPSTWPRTKGVLRTLDHCCIFLLIAGTYTPLMLLGRANGAVLLAIIWVLAACGIALELRPDASRRLPSILLYLGMGWLVVVAGRPLLTAMAPDSLAWLILGGAAYTAGVGFYAWRKLPYAHAIWHGFVLAGSSLHFFCVLTLLG